VDFAFNAEAPTIAEHETLAAVGIQIRRGENLVDRHISLNYETRTRSDVDKVNRAY